VSSTGSRPPLLRLETEPPEQISTYGALDIDARDPLSVLGLEKSSSVEALPKKALPIKEFKATEAISMAEL